MKVLFLLLAVGPLVGQSVTYSKSFPGSIPAFVEIRVDPAGMTEYRDDPKDENPIRFELPAGDRAAMMALVEKLDHFKRPLESPAKVAKMGMKSFRFERDAERYEIQFNYSEDLDAQALHDWFERIAETEQGRIELESAARFDKLGVEKALLRVEVSMDRKRLVCPRQLLPTLDKIIKNESYMHMARRRASEIAESIRATP